MKPPKTNLFTQKAFHQHLINFFLFTSSKIHQFQFSVSTEAKNAQTLEEISLKGA